MKKKWNKFLALACAAIMALSTTVTAFAAKTPAAETLETPNQYEINVGGTTVILDEGEKAEFSMELLNPNPSLYASSQTVVGNAGTLTVWGSGSYFYWTIVMTVPATSFDGYVSITDLTSGLSSGSAHVTGFSGNCACRGLSGHLYSGSLSGTAFFGTIAVAKTGSNYITWRP